MKKRNLAVAALLLTACLTGIPDTASARFWPFGKKKKAQTEAAKSDPFPLVLGYLLVTGLAEASSIGPSSLILLLQGPMDGDRYR